MGLYCHLLCSVKIRFKIPHIRGMKSTWAIQTIKMRRKKEEILPGILYWNERDLWHITNKSSITNIFSESFSSNVSFKFSCALLGAWSAIWILKTFSLVAMMESCSSFPSGTSSEWTSQQFAVSVHAHTPFSSLSNFSCLDISPILPDLQAFHLFYAT